MKTSTINLILPLALVAAPSLSKAETYGQVKVQTAALQDVAVTVTDDGYWIEYPTQWPVRVLVDKFTGFLGGTFTKSWCETQRSIIENQLTLTYPEGVKRPRAGGSEMNFVISVGPGELSEKDMLKRLAIQSKAAGFPSVPARILNPVRLQSVELAFAAKDTAMVHLEGLEPVEKFFERKANEPTVSKRGLVEAYRVPAVDLACDLMNGEIALTATVDAVTAPIEVRRTETLSASQYQAIHEKWLDEKENITRKAEQGETTLAHEQKLVVLSAAWLESEIDQAHGSEPKEFGARNFTTVFASLASSSTGEVNSDVGNDGYERLARATSSQQVIQLKPQHYRYSSVAQPVHASPRQD